LPPVRGVLRDYINSPDRVIALFPEWLTVRQPDAPPQLRYVGFLRYDEADVTPMPAVLEKFLTDGPPPIAFTPGSGMWRGQEFFETAVRACTLLGRRGVLLSRYSDHVPAQLPPEMLHVPYAPFSQLLPKCAAVVHNGGIGSCAQAMATGTPQLITPFAFDQHDNAERLVKLGVAIRVDRAEFVPQVVASALQKLTSDPSIARACAAIASRFNGVDATAEACDVIEALRQS
jgi:UDP:flavonoid glycosyltransferase YjiC (YdhE family)